MRTITTPLVLACAVSVALANSQDYGGGSDVLQHGSPESVGLFPEPLKAMVTNITNYEKPANYSRYSSNEIHPIEPGVSVIG